MRPLRLSSLSFLVAATVCVAAPGLAADGEQTDFAAALAELDRQARRGETTVEKLEESYLQLLDLPLSPEQCGLVYAAIARLHHPWARDWNVAMTYCDEALTYPLPPAAAADVYRTYARAMSARYAGWEGRRFAVARRNIARTIFAGLRVIFDAGASTRRLPYPEGDHYSIEGPLPPAVLERAERQHAEAWRVRALNELADVARSWVLRCADLYDRGPRDRDEFERLATEMLGDYPEAVQELLDDFDALIERLRGGG